MLKTTTCASGSSVRVLDEYSVLNSQTFGPFSESQLLVEVPDSVPIADDSLLEVVHNSVEVAGHDVVVSLDVPGITSYILTEDGSAPVSTAEAPADETFLREVRTWNQTAREQLKAAR